jgi:hypothetical protein
MGRSDPNSSAIGAECGSSAVRAWPFSSVSLTTSSMPSCPIDDVRKLDPAVPLAVVTLPPRGRSDAYDHAVGVFHALGAKVLGEDEVEDWTTEVAATHH